MTAQPAELAADVAAGGGAVRVTVPCNDYGAVERYLSEPAVQAALHVQPPQQWFPCAANLNWTGFNKASDAVAVPAARMLDHVLSNFVAHDSCCTTSN
jgi:hypothetical protein